MNNYIIFVYCVYLPIALVLTFFVARIFFRNAYTFMLEIFNQKVDIAKSTNHLYEVGFYLINLGFALFYMRISHYRNFTQIDVFEVLSYKIGFLAMFLGAMVFFNLYMLFRGKHKSNKNRAEREWINKYQSRAAQTGQA